MKEKWLQKSLKDVCQIKPPKSEARSLLSDRDLVSFVPMEYLGINQKTFASNQARPLSEVSGSYTYFAENDVLLAKITPCFENGKLGIATNLINGVGFGSSEYIVFRPGPLVNKEWLYYFLSREEFRREGAERMSGAVGHKRISKEFIEDLQIPIPSILEQQRIVALLDEVLKNIAIAKTNAEKKLKNAQALFESYLNVVFSKNDNKRVEKFRPLADLCELIVDCEHKTAPTQEEGIPSIRTPNIGKGELLLAGVYRVSEETYKAWTRRAKPRAGDLILAREAPAGNVAVIPKNTRLCLGQRTVLIRPKADLFDSEYLTFYLLQSNMQRKLLAHSRGATVQHVNMKDIRALDIGTIPPINEQRIRVQNINKMAKETQNLESIYQRKLAALDMLKRSLLHQAFMGNLWEAHERS